MMYKYEIEITVDDNEDVTMSIELPDQGTATHTTIDLPGSADLQCTNECTENIGKGADLKKERTVVFTKAVNMDIDNDLVRVNYLVNGKVIVKHENPKSQDESPLIKININFK